MKFYKAQVISLLVFIYLLFFPFIAAAQDIKVTVEDIVSNPSKYDGKIVEVRGKVKSLKFKISKKGNPYTVFDLVDKGQAVRVFSFGTLPIKEGDEVRVVGKYQRVKYVGPYIFYNEIDATEGEVKKIRWKIF